LMRIPSTRNIGIVGNRLETLEAHRGVAAVKANEGIGNLRDGMSGLSLSANGNHLNRITELLECECAMSGGVEAAAKIWVERARKLQKGQGRGKVNLGGKPAANGG
jgi:tRNASer (uridine44-2'-O)-methyltransferase